MDKYLEVKAEYDQVFREIQAKVDHADQNEYEQYCLAVMLRVWGSNILYSRDYDKLVTTLTGKNYTMEQVMTAMGCCADPERQLKVPAFFTELVDLDVKAHTADAATIIEKLNELFVAAAMINGDFTIEEAVTLSVIMDELRRYAASAGLAIPMFTDNRSQVTERKVDSYLRNDHLLTQDQSSDGQSEKASTTTSVGNGSTHHSSSSFVPSSGSAASHIEDHQGSVHSPTHDDLGMLDDDWDIFDLLNDEDEKAGTEQAVTEEDNEDSDLEDDEPEEEEDEEEDEDEEDEEDEDEDEEEDEEEEEEETLESLIDELNSLIGLKLVKRDIQSLINFIKVSNLRKRRGMKVPTISYHLVFTGNPGTGKTTIARLVGRLYYHMGILSKGQLVEADRSSLVAGYLGQTALKTQEVIKKAMGGVLFIDEAYALAGNEQDSYGKEAIETILKAMEDHRGELVVIVAGYTDLMHKFIDSNPGLSSRFNKYFEFPDYTSNELLSIFKLFCKNNGYKLTPEATDELKLVLEKLYAARDDHFGNARAARNIFEKAIGAQADRIAGKPQITRSDLEYLQSHDIVIATGGKIDASANLL